MCEPFTWKDLSARWLIVPAVLVPSPQVMRTLKSVVFALGLASVKVATGTLVRARPWVPDTGTPWALLSAASATASWLEILVVAPSLSVTLTFTVKMPASRKAVGLLAVTVKTPVVASLVTTTPCVKGAGGLLRSPSPQFTVTVKSVATAVVSASVNWATTALVTAAPSVAWGLLVSVWGLSAWSPTPIVMC